MSIRPWRQGWTTSDDWYGSYLKPTYQLDKGFSRIVTLRSVGLNDDGSGKPQI